MLEIKDLLKRDITRDINGVVVAEQREKDRLEKELDEYVVTKEIKEQLEKIFFRYENSLDTPTQDIGVWIAGFFGSGKSHLLKMVANLLENSNYTGKNAVEYFEEKLEGSKELYQAIKKSGEADADVLLFNIENVSTQQESKSKDAIVTAFLKKFNEMQGFSKDILKVAEFERNIWKRGRYQEFKELYNEESFETWEEGRNDLYMNRDSFLDVVEKMQIQGFSRESADKLVDDINNASLMPSPSTFVDLLEEYLASKGSNHRMFFCVDEIGQYIGGDSKLMLNLQTLVEEIGVRLKGKVWVGVTSQQNMDAIIEGAEKAKNDFSRIQGRFKTMISLSSSNIDEVIKKRLLDKTSENKNFLKTYYEGKRVNIENSINFQEAPSFKLYEDSQDFAETYPFVKYQFNLLQDIFDKVRVTGLSGKHLSSGERSLLSAFQESGIKIKDKEIGTLVPFHYFYDSIEHFLDSDGKRPVNRAINDYKMSQETVDLLKLLFLLKGMNQRVKATVENLTAFTVSNVDEDTKALKERIKKSLRDLENHNLIQREADEYFYLTNEEQNIMAEIKSINVTSREVTEYLSKVAYNDILTVGNITVKETETVYSFTKRVDDVITKPGEILSITLLTPQGDDYDQMLNIISTREGTKLILKLDEEENRYLEETKQYLRVQKYNEEKGRVQTRETLKLIIEKLVSENRRNRSTRIKTYLEQAIGNSTIYIDGSEVKLNKKGAEPLMKEALEELAKILFSKANMIKLKYDEKRIRNILSEEIMLQFDFGKDISMNSNKEAIDEVLRQIKSYLVRNEQINMRKLVDKYKNIPFGWKEMDIQGLVAELYLYKQIDLEISGEKIKDKNKAKDYLTKTQANNQEKLLIIPREDIDPTVKTKVMNSLKGIFGQNIIVQEDDIVETILRNCGRSKEQVDRELMNYNKPYPGENFLKDWKEFLNEILRAKGKTLQLIKNYLEVAKDLEDIQVEVEEVLDFFNSNKKAIFDQGLDKIKMLNSNEAIIGSVKETESAKNLETLLKDKKPYGKISKIKEYIAEIDKEILILVKAERERLKHEAGTEELDEGDYENFINSIDMIESIAIFQQNHVLLRLINKPKPSKPQVGEPTGKERVQKKLVRVMKTDIETEKDVEDYIRNMEENLRKLEKELLQAVRENKKVDVM